MVPSRFLVIATVGLALGFVAGCSKKSAPKADAQTVAPAPLIKEAEQLTGAPAVLAALDKKDYDGAISSLVQVAQSARTDQEKVSFLVLKREVQMKLAVPAQTDQKAAQALASLQMMSTGR